jgi:serine/threonine protein kinase
MDLKPANLLLNKSLMCKVGDVGLSRLMPLVKGEQVTPGSTPANTPANTPASTPGSTPASAQGSCTAVSDVPRTSRLPCTGLASWLGQHVVQP